MTLLLSKNDFKLIICLCLAFPFLYFWTVLNVAEMLRSGSGGPGTAPGPGNALAAAGVWGFVSLCLNDFWSSLEAGTGHVLALYLHAEFFPSESHSLILTDLLADDLWWRCNCVGFPSEISNSPCV